MQGRQCDCLRGAVRVFYAALAHSVPAVFRRALKVYAGVAGVFRAGRGARAAGIRFRVSCEYDPGNV